MPRLWSIVPKNDGHHVLGKDNTLVRKDAFDKHHYRLWFINKEEADAFIENCLGEGYLSEDYWTIYFNCPYCGSDLEAKTSIGADESIDGYTHTLFHCPECLRDWSYKLDNYIIIHYQRKY